jgi:hypothetical protein
VIRPDPTGERRARATREIDDGRRGRGDVFGAFRPATGAAFTAPDPGRTIANRGDCLEQAGDRLDGEAPPIYAILDNPSTHRALDVLLRAPAHPRWEVGGTPTCAASLNLIGPWWKLLRSLARKGRRFARWDGVAAAVAAATQEWTAHRHRFAWGRRKRCRAARRCGLAHLPLAA